MKYIISISLLAFWVQTVVVHAKAEENEELSSIVLGKNVMDWIVENGGFVSNKMELRTFDPSNPDSHNGIYALEDIPKEEIVLVVPRKCVLTGEVDMDFCGSAQNLVAEYTKGEDSHFAPYIQYLFDETQVGWIPSGWSAPAVELLEAVVGDGGELQPQDVAGIHYANDCDGVEHAMYEHAYQLVQSRGWEDRMLPGKSFDRVM